MDPPQARKPRNITIACEVCRRHKIRCNGAQPCGRWECQDDPRACVYRRRARMRRARAETFMEAGQRRSGSTDDTALNDEEELLTTSVDDDDRPTAAAPPRKKEAYKSGVMAVHHAPRSTDSSQLFYGPSSNFTFLQEIRRGVLEASATTTPPVDLEALLQRSISFGIPHRLDLDTIQAARGARLAVPVALAREFLTTFKVTSLPRLPFYSATELDEQFAALAWDVALPSSSSLSSTTTTKFRETTPTASALVPPQTRATFLAVLAIGALGTAHTDAAESLFVQAKHAAVVLDEAVSLQMIWLGVLLADYQINLGRPNAAYLHIGTACRKAFAFGLHKEVPNAAAATRASQQHHRGDDDVVRKHRVTLWILYIYETFHSLSMGRNSSMRMGDISCPQLTQPAPVVRLCELAHIMEATSEMLYQRTTNSLRQLYCRAEDLHRRLCRFADAHDLGSAYIEFGGPGDADTTANTIESVTLHSCYYQAVILVFRPFLVSSYAIRSGKRRGAQCDDMWLHQACRHAVSAAQDSIRFTSDAMRKVEACRKTRFQCFFLQSTCAVLLYDILCEPAMCAYNMSFLRTALTALDCMVADESIVTVAQTVRQVAKAVEKAVAAMKTMSDHHHLLPSGAANTTRIPESRGYD